MASIANLAVSLSANTTAFTEGMNKAANKTREFSRTFDRELVKSAISVGALKLAASQLNRALDEGVRVSEEYAAGTLTAADAFEGLARSAGRAIPIVGELFRAGESISTILTNMDQSVRAFNEAITAQEVKLSRVAASQKVYEKASEQAAQGAQSLARQLQLLNTRAEDQGMVAAGHAYEDAMQKAAGLRDELAKISKLPVFAEKREELEANIQAIEAGANAVLNTQRRLAAEAKNAPVSKMIEDLVRQVEEFGVPAFDKMRKQVMETFGPESVAFVDQYKAKLDGLEEAARQRAEWFEQLAQDEADAEAARNKLMEAGIRVYESTRTEIEKHEAELTRLSDLLNAGAINWDTYARAVKQANEQLSAQNTIAEAPGARVVRFSQGMPGTRVDTQSKIEKNTKEQLDIAKKHLEAARTLVSQTKNGVGITVVDNF